MSKKENFIINGPNKEIRAMITTLRALGWKLKGTSKITNATVEIDNNDYQCKKGIFRSSTSYGVNKEVYTIFTLPKDEKKAINFAIKLLEIPTKAKIKAKPKAIVKPKPKFKKGDKVVFTSEEENGPAKIGEIYTVVSGPIGTYNKKSTYKIQVLIGLAPSEYSTNVFRKATEEEAKVKNPTVLNNVGSKSATLTIYKDKVVIHRFGDIAYNSPMIFVNRLKEFYNRFSGSNDLGSYMGRITHREWRFILIGCDEEDNRVSLDEIRKVLSIAENL